LLERLRLPFDRVAPEVDESALPGERPIDTAARLARAKANTVAARYPKVLVIGADQVAELDGTAIGKPGDHARASAQLRAASGRQVEFHSALAVVDARDGRVFADLVTSRVKFRQLSEAQIEAYLRAEPAYDCAGSAKAEGLGICLIERIDAPDPTALIGLPLIALTNLLALAGLAPV
jgi:septum formation protein